MGISYISHTMIGTSLSGVIIDSNMLEQNQFDTRNINVSKVSINDNFD